MDDRAIKLAATAVLYERDRANASPEVWGISLSQLIERVRVKSDIRLTKDERVQIAREVNERLHR